MIFQKLRIVHLFEKDLQNRRATKDKENAEFQREMIELGDALIMAMNKESQRHGAEFLLVTQMPWLHERMVKRGVRSLDVRSALNDPTFKLPRGLSHLNEYGNHALASAIAGFLQQEGLIPARHLMSFAPQAEPAE